MVEKYIWGENNFVNIEVFNKIFYGGFFFFQIMFFGSVCWMDSGMYIWF